MGDGGKGLIYRTGGKSWIFEYRRLLAETHGELVRDEMRGDLRERTYRMPGGKTIMFVSSKKRVKA
jgi:hypothetical protein